MSVLDGPRREIRRILDGGSPQWVTPSDDGSELVLMDGRRARSQRHLPASVRPDEDPAHPPQLRLAASGVPGPTVDHSHVPKPTTALNSHRGVLYRPADCRLMNYEGEVAAVIGRPMRNVARDDVWEHLAGFAPRTTSACTTSARWTGSMLRVKGQDGYCPIGPGLVWAWTSASRCCGPTSTVRSSRRPDRGDDVPDRLHPRRPLSPHHAAAGRRDPDRHPANSRLMQLDDVVEVEVTGGSPSPTPWPSALRPATRWGTRRRTPRASCGWPTAVTAGRAGRWRAAAQAAVDAVPSPSTCCHRHDPSF